MGDEVGSDAIYKFGAFSLDARRHILWKKGKKVDLNAKPMKVLLALVESNGDLVTFGELMTKVWGTTEVGDNNRNQQISVLRKVLGESPKENKYIQTIPRDGYRFVAHVEKVRMAIEVPARQPKPDIIRILPPGDSGYRTVVLGSDEDHVVDGSGKVVRPGDRVIENVEHIDTTITREQADGYRSPRP